MAIFRPKAKNEEFGPPYAVINLSRIGLRYFRLFINASPKTKELILKEFSDHPNIGWVFEGYGWFNVAIGVWAHSNSEINDLSEAIRRTLGPKDKIVYQSELTALYSFGNQPILPGRVKPMPIVDSALPANPLSDLELDYIKIITLDDSLSHKELADILAIRTEKIEAMRAKLEKDGIIVGRQKRINYAGHYFKVFIDSSSGKTPESAEEVEELVWKDKNCIYFEKANGKYDLEFELILSKKSQIKKYIKSFSEVKVVHLSNNLYTNLYPLSKVANILEIHELIKKQIGEVIDFRNSKLWYLNHKGVKAYLNIYRNEKYFETMEKGELDLFDQLTSYIKKSNQNSKFNVIDIGSGNGMKGKLFIESLGESKTKAYYAVDSQPIELLATMRVHQGASYGLHPVMLDFEKMSARFPLKLVPGESQLYMFFGGTYGNFQAYKINSMLKPLLASKSSRLFVAMPIINQHINEQDLIEMYSTHDIENMAYGPLSQMGFKKSELLTNPYNSKLKVHINLEDKRVVSTLVLNKTKQILGNNLKKGTAFKMITSWKPTLEEFKQALEEDFTVKHIIHNDKMAIAEVAKKS